jgi:miniconductance mechanosensitive channel
VVLVLSLVFGQEPGYYLAGFGAATAILLLIFRDPILGLVAGVQLSLNDMVQEGDWIEVPKHGADGEVLDVSLTTVKVRNWDKTITTIPAYQLVSDSFKNWRGMSESGGRRIKRALAVDIASVRFLTDGMLERLMSNELLRPALEKRLAEVHRANSKQEADLSEPANGRRLTNLGSFRLYTELYLRNHPHVREDMTFLVRQLDPSPRGIPLEVYVFTDTTDWAAYESIQADIFDHLLAVASRFKLRLFQEPGSGDFAGLEEAVNDALKRR